MPPAWGKDEIKDLQDFRKQKDDIRWLVGQMNNRPSKDRIYTASTIRNQLENIDFDDWLSRQAGQAGESSRARETSQAGYGGQSGYTAQAGNPASSGGQSDYANQGEQSGYGELGEQRQRQYAWQPPQPDGPPKSWGPGPC
ncbi:uncharacterized protein LY89DRAFT_717164 [Mollisia scopiformis]|uniref:Uncharacterized protein n=1 Tax=Mollisia scopiformis TaxID=149040 RepID=A0A194XEH2_MOLSC|nr:uncharacterized protein LY89DRAFT_717164 [Mollisia scopiformis]KUJ18573.1 hypothetical protein LY89DRAFT_717164 [Mollisia scopiformis]